MIESLLRECGDVEGVARLFGELGYPVTIREVESDALAALGLVAEGLPFHHLTRHGGVDLYVATAGSDDDRQRIREFERVIAERNHVVRPVIVELAEGTSVLSIHGRCGRSRRRLDIDTASPSPDSLDRIYGLMIRGKGPESVDPGLLFERALDREALGRRFFEQFRRSVLRIARELRERFPDEPAGDCRDEALLLMSRVLFVYLIQRKGWLDGDHRFLRERLAACLRQEQGFHETVVTPLFFDCLNRPRTRRPTGARRLGRIPYLNGGLFEPSAFEKRNEPIALANDVWREILDSTFEPFSLSVSEVDEEGAHVDPEMLGKVFEKLMESEERARTGSFYTPREVVDSLTRSAIVRWCAGGQESIMAALHAMMEGRDAGLDTERASGLLHRLDGITVLDPACGSGAFLLAALRTIESLTKALASRAGVEPPLDLRARIAARSLHGVDLKMEAVRLCELRLWLAIVSGSELDADEVPPLPNLDRNVLQGDSLVGPLDFLSGEAGDIYRDWVRGLNDREHLLHAYRRSSSTRRQKLAARLRESDRSLARALLSRSIDRDREDARVLREADKGLFDGAPELSREERTAIDERIRSKRKLLARLEREEISFFSFDLHFATVRARGGFSVVLGNPPWVRGSRVEPGLRRLLANRYRSFSSEGSSGFRQSELAMAFVERSLSLAAPDGVIAQLLPSKVTSADYAAEVRRELLSEASVDEVCDWSTEGKELFDADVFPLGIVASKAPSTGEIVFRSGREAYPIGRDEISVSGPGSAWSTLPPEVRAITNRIRQRCRPLEEILGRRPVMGIKTGANSRFFLEDVAVVDGRVSLPSLGLTLPAGAVVRTVRGRDLKRWCAADSTWMLWPAGINGDRQMALDVARALSTTVAALRLSYVKSEHLGLKVAWKDVSRGLCAAILPDRTVIGGVSFSVVPNQTLYSIDVATKDEGLVLAGLLNSTVVNALALETAERAKDHHWRYLAGVVASVSLPDVAAGSDDARVLSRLARRAELGDANGDDLNSVVSRMYGLSRDEHARLERFVEGRLGRDGDVRF